MRRPLRATCLALAGWAIAAAAIAAPAEGRPAAPQAPAASRSPAAAIAAGPPLRTGREIYAQFRAGLAEPECTVDPSERWSRHFAHVPGQLAQGRGDVLALFGYVVDALREAGLPTEYALIPFVESGYKPGARSSSGPAGLWQFIEVTARNHKIAIRPGYDGRLSPVDSTRAAVRYLKTLHGMFAGDWRLAVMAYNAGEYRVLGALKRHGQRPADAEPAKLESLSGITQAYVRKLHALSCVLAEADDREQWMDALDREVPRLASIGLPATVDSLGAWAARQGLDSALVRRLNPAFGDGALGRVPSGSSVLAPEPAPRPAEIPVAATAAAPAAAVLPPSPARSPARTHVVVRGENPSTIARRHGLSVPELLRNNGLDAASVLHPGTILRLDGPTSANASAATVAN